MHEVRGDHPSLAHENRACSELALNARLVRVAEQMQVSLRYSVSGDNRNFIDELCMTIFNSLTLKLICATECPTRNSFKHGSALRCAG